MNDTDEVTERLEARMAYLGIRDKSPTADLLPTRSFPSGMVDPECRDVAAFLVRLVRSAYVRCRKQSREVATRRPDRYGDHWLERWDGGYDWQGRYHAPVWARIAGAALGREFDVVDYVEAQYARAAGVGSPYPNKLLSSEALELHERERMPQVIRQGHIGRRSMESRFAGEISRVTTVYDPRNREAEALVVLRDPTNSLGPFFRYWVIAQCDRGVDPYPQIRAYFRRGALLQYASSVRAYETAYDHPVLAEFRAVVARTRLSLDDLTAEDQDRWVGPPADVDRPGPRHDEA